MLYPAGLSSGDEKPLLIWEAVPTSSGPFYEAHRAPCRGGRFSARCLAFFRLLMPFLLDRQLTQCAAPDVLKTGALAKLARLNHQRVVRFHRKKSVGPPSKGRTRVAQVLAN